MKHKILLVDDERNILDAYQRNLRQSFDIETAENGIDGIIQLQENGPFSVVVSDYRMPKMDGIQFLSQARQIAPQTVRIMLSGQADLQATINAVNEGNLFRFLLKPCAMDVFIQVISDAVEQYNLIRSEKELLDQTVKGSIKLLIDILSILSPMAFSQTPQIQALCHKLAIRLGINNTWEIDLASMLSQIGCVSIPNHILEKQYHGDTLDEAESEVFQTHPEIGRRLLINIPRMEHIAEAISYQEKYFDGGGIPRNRVQGGKIPFSARIIKVVLDFNILLRQGKTPGQAITEMYNALGIYDPDVLAALDSEILSIEQGYVAKAILIDEITPGMILADDIRDVNGVVLIPKGHALTDILKLRLKNYAVLGSILEPIKIMMSIK
ncbi:MAG: response regulator [Peptococcaceae bacterium]|nr:response regulator [Peptococcaceae bacterium]